MAFSVHNQNLPCDTQNGYAQSILPVCSAAELTDELGWHRAGVPLFDLDGADGLGERPQNSSPIIDLMANVEDLTGPDGA